MDTKNLITRLSDLSKKYHAVQQELTSTYQFDDRDVRVNVFKHCYIIIDSTYIFILVRDRHLFDEKWWEDLMTRKLVSSGMTEQQRSVFIHGFDTYVDSSFLVMLLFSIESAFRSFYPLIFRDNPPISFKKLYEKFLPAFGLDKYIELLNLASLTRNTLHNGSLHNWENDSVDWGGKTYYFEKGKTVELGDAWSTLTTITEDIHEMLEKLVKSDRILKEKQIIDASYATV
jgi:hypothetical protein